MQTTLKKRVLAALTSAALCTAIAGTQPILSDTQTAENTAYAAETTLTLDDLPSDYAYAAEWIWTNRIVAENSTARWNTIFDQIIAGKGSINYVVKWQSYKQITLEQRQQMEVMLSDAINAWTDYLVGYDGWPYDTIDVNIVGWAVIDASCILDPQADEIIYTDTKYYDSQYDTSNGYETIPDKEPYAPDELSRFYHFEHRLEAGFDAYQYPGGLDKRFDMYMWATQGFPSIGGCGGDWGQRLSDDAYLNMLGGSNIHVQVHEVGHGFGITDFYGGEGESNGYPPGGFPGGGTSIMMAGSSAVITDFDAWLLRYIWSQIKDESGRFDLENALPETTEPSEETTEPSEETTEPSEETTEEPTQPSATAMEFADGTLLALENANSGLFLGVENGIGGNTANVCQYGSGTMQQNIWKLKSAGNGYYYLYSALEGGETYLLDVYYALADDGTNINIYENTGSPAQLFKFVDNGDGTCRILTSCSGDASCLQTANASVDAGANVEEWSYNGSTQQHWILHYPRFMGYKGDVNGATEQLDLVDGQDVAILNDYLLTTTSLSSVPMEFKDMNDDGVLDVFDLAILKSMANGSRDLIPLYNCP